MSYHIINLSQTRLRQQLTFWGVGNEPDTTDPRRALIVNEEYLNRNLERYDNGRTTRAILTRVVENHTGDWRELMGWPVPENELEQTGDAA